MFKGCIDFGGKSLWSLMDKNVLCWCTFPRISPTTTPNAARAHGDMLTKVIAWLGVVALIAQRVDTDRSSQAVDQELSTVHDSKGRL